MKLFTELVSDKVSDAFEKAGYDREFGAVSISKRPDLCEFQCNGCMALAKKERQRLPSLDLSIFLLQKKLFLNILTICGMPISLVMNQTQKAEKQ